MESINEELVDEKKGGKERQKKGRKSEERRDRLQDPHQNISHVLGTGGGNGIGRS